MIRDVTTEVIAILARQAVLDPQDVTLDRSPEDLGLDSLGLVESIFAIEETFDITVPFNANDPQGGDFDLSSVGSIVAHVKKLIAAQG
ncbi:MAG: acyl carrier protein [Rhodobacteraceae bacterium]|nr:acyl carrier protein [Paracoccaceae bacterium]